MSQTSGKKNHNFIAPMQVRRGAVYTLAALLWVGIVFLSYFYINFHWLWDKIVELWNWLFK